ncbi:MAG: nucleoside triphosphate pyrophosphatase [Desulfuromonadaceae bacterium]|nr:Maf family protein [Desulfuromonas sp.]MDY0185077.1 nucleoside triphosphate pyrophosphatase [Desulfuromonadaceae bacterium]
MSSECKERSGIVLASASPRRREMLQRMGVRFQVIPADVDEQAHGTETPEAFVVRLSRDKALEVAQRHPTSGRWFIGSDTIVVCGGVIMGKPEDDTLAAQMLRRLSGTTHEVLSAYAIYDGQNKGWKQCCVSTEVQVRALTEHEIEGYIASGEPADKAGAYAIQGLGAFMVSAINGSYTSVVGLPLSELLMDLEELGAHRMFDAT